MAPIKTCTVVALFGLAQGTFIKNAGTGLCLDVERPCVNKPTEEEKKANKCDKEGRVKTADLDDGADVQQFKCHGGDNQQWEYLSNGRIRNKGTSKCIDVQACEDATAEKCKIVKVGGVKKMANVQLWSCHADDGKLSKAYGNQKFEILANGQIQNPFANAGKGLCLDVQADYIEKDGKKVYDPKSTGDMSTIQVYDCHDKIKGNQRFHWALEDTTLPTRLFQTISDSNFLRAKKPARGQSNVFLPLAGVCSLAVAAAAFVGTRATRSPVTQSPSE